MLFSKDTCIPYNNNSEGSRFKKSDF